MSAEVEQNREFKQFGGQAVIEGVMMRSPRFFAVACRKPDGVIVVQNEPVEATFLGKLKWMNRPFLRGSFALIDSMALGMKALNFAAQVQVVVADKVETDEKVVEEKQPEKPSRINDIVIGSTMVVSIAFGLALFVALPTLVVGWVQPRLGIPHSPNLSWKQQTELNLADGCTRITIFLLYISAIARMQNIHRVFQFHGAEHKAINALEFGEDLTVENCMKQSRIHPRCGTSFIVVVFLASIIVHSLFPRPENALVRVALHLSLVPFVAGIAYEVIRLAGKYRHLAITRFLLSPGLASQLLTTREPDAEHIEVAIASLVSVIEAEKANATPIVGSIMAGSAIS